MSIGPSEKDVNENQIKMFFAKEYVYWNIIYQMAAILFGSVCIMYGVNIKCWIGKCGFTDMQ